MKNRAVDPVIGFLTNSISKPYGHADSVGVESLFFESNIKWIRNRNFRSRSRFETKDSFYCEIFLCSFRNFFGLQNPYDFRNLGKNF